jgi:hypothetical protein
MRSRDVPQETGLTCAIDEIRRRGRVSISGRWNSMCASSSGRSAACSSDVGG